MRYAAAFFLVCCISWIFSGCTVDDTTKAKNLANKYIKQKYGFTAKILNVHLDRPSWLEFRGKKPGGAYVRMEHDGVEFLVRVNFKSESADSYEINKIEGEAKEYFEQKLDAQKLAVRLEFIEDHRLPNLATKNVRSFQDVIKSDKCSLAVAIYTYGLKEKSLNNIDIKELGNYAKIGISDWKVADFPTDHADIYSGLQEAYDRDLVYLNAHYFIDKQGKVTAQHYNVEKITEDVSIVIPDDLKVRLEKLGQQPNFNEIKILKTGSEKKISQKPTTPWYRVRVLGGNYKFGVSRAIIFSKARSQDKNLKPLEGDREGTDTRYAMECIKPYKSLKGELGWSSEVMLQPGALSNYSNRQFLCSAMLILERENMFRVVIRE